MISTLTLATIQKGLNTALSLDPGSQNTLEKILDKSIKINCESPATSFYIRIDEKDKITLHQLNEETYHLLLTGTGNQYVQLFTNITDKDVITNSELKIEGEIGLLGTLVMLLANLDIDWEEALVAIIGDLAAHPLADTIRKAANWAKQQSSGLNDVLRDYIHYELALFPTEPEFDNFKTDLNDLIDEIANIENRLTQLKDRFPKSTSDADAASSNKKSGEA